MQFASVLSTVQSSGCHQKKALDLLFHLSSKKCGLYGSKALRAFDRKFPSKRCIFATLALNGLNKKNQKYFYLVFDFKP